MRVATLTTWNENGVGTSQQGSEDWIPASAGMTIGIGDGQPQGLLLRWVCWGLYSQQSFMSVATDTTNHENGHRFLRRRLSYGNVRGWIPAFAGMTVAVCIERVSNKSAESVRGELVEP